MPRFPITVWPGPIDVLSWRCDQFLRNGRCFWDTGNFLEGEGWELPEEFYLREIMDINLHSDDDVAALVEAHGFLLFSDREARDVPGDIWDFPRALDGLPPGFSNQAIWSMEGRYLGDRFHEFREGVEARFGSWDTYIKRASARKRRKVILYELAIETRLGLACLRDLSRTLQHWQRNGLRTLPDEWDLSLFDVDPPKGVDEAFTFLVDVINGALRDVSARLLTEADFRVGGNVFVATVAQMFNHIAEDATYKVCANETCQRTFVHQVDGTSMYGQYRGSGVRYCSNRCAKAQAQREYRRRRKKTPGGDGASS